MWKLCTVAGLLIGLFHGLDQPPVRAARCSGGGKCVSEGIMAGVTPILIPSLVGAVLGTMVGVMLGVLVKRAGVQAPRSKRPNEGRWIKARYAGRCERCSAEVVPGDRVFHRPERRKVTCPACTYV